MICSNVHELKFNKKFRIIHPTSPLREMPPDVVNDLSTDQRYAYRIVKMITTGVIDEDLVQLKVGEVCPSRWLTTGNRFARVWISFHGIVGNDLKVFHAIMKYLINGYFFMWFEIKIDSSIVAGPYHVLRQIQCIQEMKGKDEISRKVKEIAKKYIEKSAWNAHTEILITSLLCSEQESDRRFAVEKLTALRDGNNLGDKSVRPFEPPKLNWNAKSIPEIQDWENATEPIITASIPTCDLAKFITSPMKLPKIPSHTQSCERAVKEVTHASACVFGAERRDGFIRAKLQSRAVVPRMERKKDFEGLIPK